MPSDTDKYQRANSWGMDLLVVGPLAFIALVGIMLLSDRTARVAPANNKAVNEDVYAMCTQHRDDQWAEKCLDALRVEERAPYPSAPEGAGFISLMGDNLNADVWYVSQHENKTGFYGADWKIDNVSVANQGTAISVLKPTENQDRPTAAELKTLKRYSYGTYQARLRPARGSGIVSAFFTYTGPYFGDPHDEIDFEFLGQDLTKVHLNYWKDGAHGDSKIIDLGFDAGEAAHLYTFVWTPDRIVWKVDNKVIHQTVVDDPFIPRTPGNIYFSTWTGSKAMQAWHGAPTYESGTETDISCVSFVPMDGENTGQKQRACSDFYPRAAK